jgi:CelD/BcsL family acetyltransferase involved in cellulose biosynthesis
MGLAIDWIADGAGLAALEGEWEAMLPESAHPFDLHCWYMAWWEAFGGSVEPAVCTVRRGGELVGVFPLRREGKLLKELANVHSCISRPLAADEEAMDALIAAALAGGRSGMELILLPSNDRSVAAIESQARDARMRSLAEPESVAPIVDTNGDVEAWRREKKSSWKARLARYRRKMDRDHDANFEIVAAPDDLGAWLEEGFRLEGSGWKGEAGTAILSAPDTAAFYADVARRFHDRGELRLSRISLDGVGVAFSYCILKANRLYSLKTGYDESRRKLVPGLVLQLSIVERCFELGIDAYELLGVTSDWKEKIATGSRSYTTLRVFPAGPAGAVRYAYRAKIRPPLRAVYRRALPRSR